MMTRRLVYGAANLLARNLRLLGLGLLLLGMAMPAPAAMADLAATVPLVGSAGSGVNGTATLSAEGSGTTIVWEVRGLPPGASVQASLHGGTCEQPSASFSSLPGATADSDGHALARGRVQYRDTDEVPFRTIADGAHVIAVATAGRVVACGVVARPAASDPSATVLSEGERYQVIQFNPGAALQKHIFTDGFVPNSPEFRLDMEGTSFAAQRAEHLRNGVVRVYYARTGNWSNVSFYQRDSGRDPLGTALLAEAERRQLIRFNPGAALQKQIFADHFVPNSDEFTVLVDGITYTAQRAEHLGSGNVRVYYGSADSWDSVRFVQREGSDVSSRWITYADQRYPYFVSYPSDWERSDAFEPQASPTVGDLERVTLRQPGYGTAGKFTTIDISAAKGGWPTTGIDCTPNTTVADVPACDLHMAAAQNPAQDLVKFQRGDVYYEIRIVLADDQNAESQLGLFRQILGSIKFTN